MRILRLTNSNDALEEIPAELRSGAIAERVVAELTGEQVETIQRVMWPSAVLPGIVDRWIRQYEPDIVFVRTSSFWVSYESVPLRVRRKLGRFGGVPSRIGLKVGGDPRFASSRAGKAIRRMAARTIGGDTHFTVEEAARHMEAVVRVVLAYESILPVVRGPGHAFNAAGTARGLAGSRRRCDEFESILSDFCRRLHVAFAPAGSIGHQHSFLRADEVHEGPEGQRLYGEFEGALIARAWLEAKASGMPPARRS